MISVATTWATQRFGSAGIYALAAIVGVSDIDPFVLNLAQGDAAQLTVRVGAGAILVAASSNNVVKADRMRSYIQAHACAPRRRRSTLLAVLGVAAAAL